MSLGLLIIERMVLESLNNKEKTIMQLKEDTKINEILLWNIIKSLMERSMVKKHNGHYKINTSNINNWLDKINNDNNKKEEIKELFVSLVNQYYSQHNNDTKIHLKKVYLTPRDEERLELLISAINSFLDDVKNNQFRSSVNELSSKKIIFVGQSNYIDLVNNSLESA